MDKPCEDCGEMMYGVHHTRRFCSRCADKRNAARVKQRNAEKVCSGSVGRERPRRRKKKKSAETLGKINAKARQAGLSYGKYTAGRSGR